MWRTDGLAVSQVWIQEKQMKKNACSPSNSTSTTHVFEAIKQEQKTVKMFLMKAQDIVKFLFLNTAKRELVVKQLLLEKRRLRKED